MQNPFDDDSGEFLVLANDRAQHSLWPAHLDVPAGWSASHGPDTRAACLAHVDQTWSDLRPARSPS